MNNKYTEPLAKNPKPEDNKEIFYISIRAAVKQLDGALDIYMRHFGDVLESGCDLSSIEDALDEGAEMLKKYRQIIEAHEKKSY